MPSSFSRHSRALASSISSGTPAASACADAVVDVEHLGVAARLELEQGQVPPVAHGDKLPSPQSSTRPRRKGIRGRRAHASPSCARPRDSPYIIGMTSIADIPTSSASRTGPTPPARMRTSPNCRGAGVTRFEGIERAGWAVSRLRKSPRKKSSWWPTCNARTSLGQENNRSSRIAEAPCQSPASHAPMAAA